MKLNKFNDAAREQTSILAPLEQMALQAFVRRMPSAVNSDHLSALGLVAMFLGGMCYALSRTNSKWLIAVNVCIFLNWFGDSLDGTLARYRNRLRPRYGFYVDHIIDAFGAFFLVLGLAISGYMSERVAGGVLVVFMMLSINTYLTAYALGVFKISQWKMGPTEMRLLLIVGNFYLMHRPTAKVFGQRYLLFDIGGVFAVIGMALVLIFLAIKNTHTLYNLERLPKMETSLPANVSLDQI